MTGRLLQRLTRHCAIFLQWLTTLSKSRAINSSSSKIHPRHLTPIAANATHRGLKCLIFPVHDSNTRFKQTFEPRGLFAGFGKSSQFLITKILHLIAQIIMKYGLKIGSRSLKQRKIICPTSENGTERGCLQSSRGLEIEALSSPGS
jgi:hypothetical protein